MNEQRLAALAQARARSTMNALRHAIITRESGRFRISCAVQIVDATQPIVMSVDVANLIDTLSPNMLHSDVTNLIMASDAIYDQLARHYETHNIHIDIMYDNQPVLSTTYPYQPPF